MVYLVIRNDSDCDFVQAVFNNKENAEKYIKALPPQHDRFKIEEWITSDE